MKFKNISPLGELYVPSLEITVAPGETVEITDEVDGVALSAQPDVWQAVDKPAKAAAAENTEPATIAEPEPDPSEPEPSEPAESPAETEGK